MSGMRTPGTGGSCAPSRLAGTPLRVLCIGVFTVALLAQPIVPGLSSARGQDAPEITREELDRQIEDSEAELERIRSDLRKKREQAEELVGQEHDLLGEIDRINEEIDVNRELLNKLAEKKEVLLQDLGFAQQDLGVAEARLETAQSVLDKRLRAIYKFGRGERMEVILLSKTFADLAKRIYYLSVITAHDRELMAVFEERVEIRRILKEHIEGKKARIEAVELEVEQETRNLQLKKEERDALVARLKEKRYYYENLARQLEQASRSLEGIIGNLETQRAEVGVAGTVFEGQMGKLMWPCDGEVISEFGMQTHPRFGTILRNNGVDIKTEPGAKVRAVAPGEVSFSGTLSGFGNCIVISHGEGFYTLYGHLESMMVSKGYEVRAGDAIGVIGESSTPEGAVLHFEIRQGKEPLDPSEWLSR